MTIGRRQFIKGSLIGMGGAMLGCSSDSAGPSAQKTPSHFDPAEIVPLGKTGLKASRVGIGTGMRGFNRQSNHTRAGHWGGGPVKIEGLTDITPQAQRPRA